MKVVDRLAGVGAAVDDDAVAVVELELGGQLADGGVQVARSIRGPNSGTLSATPPHHFFLAFD
jgi:hypothetical protein